LHGYLDSLARIELLQRWLAAGMELGNHTYSHADLNTTPVADYEADIMRGEIITGKLLRERGLKERYFRYPYNHTGPTAAIKDSIELFLKSRGYSVAPFTIEHSDYVFNKVYDDALAKNDSVLLLKVKDAYCTFLDTAFSFGEAVSKIYFGYEPAQILLIHANAINAECLDAMLSRIEKRGYTFVSFEDALKDPLYSGKDEYVGKYGISWLHRWTVNRGIKMLRRGDPDPPQFILDLYEAH
jgi:peptidoglycan/xylan/chitin deacetylase (PgdA/CDA1 family)